MVHTTNIVQLMFPHCQVKCLDDPLSVGPAMVVLRVDRENLWGKPMRERWEVCVISRTAAVKASSREESLNFSTMIPE